MDLGSLVPAQLSPDHLATLQQFIQGNYVNVVTVIGSYKSWIAGIKYQQEKPSKGQLYQCIPDVNNKFDVNAIKIINSNNQTIGYLPRDMAQSISSFNNANIFIVCSCLTEPTEKSAQAIFTVLTSRITLTDIHKCSLCQLHPCDTKIQPCKHDKFCLACVSRLVLKSCPVCRVTIHGLERMG